MQRCNFRSKPKSKACGPAWSASGAVTTKRTQGTERKLGSGTVIALHVSDPSVRFRKSEATETFAVRVQNRLQVNGSFAVQVSGGIANEEVAVKNCNDR